jgi:hypothetical protein
MIASHELPDIQAHFTNINEDSELIRLHALSEKLKTDKARILRELAHCSTAGPVGPVIRHDPSGDAAALLAGTPVESLEAPAEENRRFSLLRQLRAVELAIPESDDRRREAFLAACQNELSRLRPVLAASYEPVLLALEALGVCLRDHHDLINRILTHGMYYQVLGAWVLTPMERGLLFGGNLNPAIDFYIAGRREALGLERTQ